jgi:hypothetical protein
MSGTYLAASVRTLAGQIADAIETQGHYQGVGRMASVASPGGPCCVVVNEPYRAAPSPVKVELDRRLCEMAGIRVRPDEAPHAVVDVNDHTPTPDLLAMLREIAAEEA